MNRIDALFQQKKQNILSIYFTAGHPGLNYTSTIIETLEKQGVDMVEIGMPFSDPMADGPVIQKSSQTALNNGMSLKLLFEQLKDIRKKVQIPLLLMGYLNPVYRYGVENFCKSCNKVGIDGLILPDLPIDEYENDWKSVMDKNGLYNIFLVSPQTSAERIKKLDQLSNGFIYMVSSYSTTGSGKNAEISKEYLEKMRQANLKNPRVIGFGIKDKTSFQEACKFAQGAIIGSSFVNTLEKEGKLEDKISNFVQSILN